MAPWTLLVDSLETHALPLNQQAMKLHITSDFNREQQGGGEQSNTGPITQRRL
jgi:hypothetical protein